MARNIFLVSVVLCLLCVGLSQVSDPSVFGIREEPERITTMASRTGTIMSTGTPTKAILGRRGTGTLCGESMLPT